MIYHCEVCGTPKKWDDSSILCPCGGLLELREDGRPFFAAECQTLSLGEGKTPILAFHSNLWLKMEYMNPTLSFKDRGALYVVARALKIRKKDVMIDSSGNAAAAVAAYGARAGLRVHVFVPASLSPKKEASLRRYGAILHLIEGGRFQVSEAAMDFHIEEGIHYASHVYDPLFYQGVMGYFEEILQDLGFLPSLVLPVGNGTFLLALEAFCRFKGLRWPELVIAQPQRSASLGTARNEETLAEGVAVPHPPRLQRLRSLMKRGEARLIEVTEDEIRQAAQELSWQGIDAEWTAAMNYGAWKRLKGERGRYLIPICGSGLKNCE